MKRFFQMFAITLVIVEVFLFFGGYLLFDFNSNYYRAGAAWAFIIALIIYGFAVQSEKIEELEKRIELLEKDVEK